MAWRSSAEEDGVLDLPAALQQADRVGVVHDGRLRCAGAEGRVDAAPLGPGQPPPPAHGLQRSDLLWRRVYDIPGIDRPNGHVCETRTSAEAGQSSGHSPASVGSLSLRTLA